MIELHIISLKGQKRYYMILLLIFNISFPLLLNFCPLSTSFYFNQPFFDFPPQKKNVFLKPN